MGAEVRRRVGGRTAWVLGAVGAGLLCVVALVVAWAALFAQAMSTLPTYPETVTGTVVGLHEEDYPSTHYHPCGPLYEFEVDGRTYRASSPNVGEGWCSVDVGDRILLAYDPSDPQELNAPASEPGGTWVLRGALSLAALALAASVCCVVVAVRRPRRRGAGPWSGTTESAWGGRT